MPDVTVTCGCSRTMRPDPLRGSHAYVCGCGTRVRVTLAAPKPRCIGLTGDGARCPLGPIRESSEYGIPLCETHYDAYLDALRLLNEAERAKEVINAAFEVEMKGVRVVRLAMREDRERRYEEGREHAVVYYVRIRDTIKIGYTTNMYRRMTGGMMPDEVLAMEPGARELETLRHKEFAHLKIRGERFTPADDLLAHIEMLRQHFGRPVRVKEPSGPTSYTWEPM